MIQARALTEVQIRYALSNTNSCSEAARFLNVHLTTFRKYANRYIDTESGKTLYELHKNVGGRGVSRQTGRRRNIKPKVHIPMPEIFANRVPGYNRTTFKYRLFDEGYKEECCENCDWLEGRVMDDEIKPLVVEFLDGNRDNYALGNLRILCFNCYHNLVGYMYSHKIKSWAY